MVTEDPSQVSIPNPLTPKPAGLNPLEQIASPIDRLGAVIIDVCMVLAPGVLLFIAPLRRRVTEAVILQNDSHLLEAGILSAFLCLFTVWLYQTVMHWKYGATLGKLFCNLRVVQVGSWKRPSFLQAGLRSASWMGEVLLLFPFLTVFSHPKRRTVHDRLSDTIVLSVKKPAGPPEFWEKAFVNGFYAALFAFVLLTVIGVCKGIIDDSKDQSKILSALEDKGELCASVGVAAKTWPEEKVAYGSERLNVAMAMFAASMIGKSCLAQETAHLSSRLRDEEPLLYLAQSFVQLDNAKLSNEYLDRVCQLDKKSEACKMSEIIGAWSEEDWETVDKLFSGLRGSTNLHMAVWAIRHLMKQERYFEALAYIERISPQKTLAPFLNSQRVKAYWNSNRFSEARAVAAASIDVVDVYDSVDLASWLCRAEMEQSCSSTEALSCRAMNKYMASGDSFLADEELAVTRVQQFECGPDKMEKLRELASKVPQKAVREYIEGLELYHNEEFEQAQTLMKGLAKDAGKDELGLMAKRKLISWSTSKSHLEKHYEDWSRLEQNEDWVKIGKSLFYKYYAMGVFGKSLQIGKDLLSTPVADGMFYRAMVLSAYHVGRRKDAYALLKAYRSLGPDLVSLRLPASESEFQVISRVLDKENGQR